MDPGYAPLQSPNGLRQANQHYADQTGTQCGRKRKNRSPLSEGLEICKKHFEIE